MVKIALVGIGSMGGVHFNSYKNIENAQIIAVADVRTEMAAEKVNDKNIRIYDSMDSLLENESPDIVDICTPSYLHAELSIKALERGINVLCEKPMALSGTETNKILDAIKKSGKSFMTAHVLRFMSDYKYLKGVVDSGELGKPIHVDMKRISRIPMWSHNDWMRDIKKSGGSPIDLSVHDIDFVQDTFGRPEEVSGVYYKLKNNNDYIVSSLVYNGFDINITGGWFECDIPFKAEYLAIFEKGYVESKDGKVIKNGEEVDLVKGFISEDTGINLTGADGYADEIEYFVNCIENGKSPTRITPESSSESIELVERILSNCTKINK